MQKKVTPGIQLAVVLLQLLTGCQTSAPAKSELAQVRAGEKSLVLVRLSGEHLGTSFPAAGSPGIGSNRFYFARGDFNAMSGLKKWSMPRHLSRESAKDGWVFFALEPGQHLFTVRGSAEQERLNGPPAFRFEVPPDAPLVYAGSLRISVSRTSSRFAPGYTVSREGVEISDESAAARQIASELLAEFEPPRTVLMRHYNQPLPDHGAPDQIAMRLNVVKSSVSELSEIKERNVAQGAAPGLAMAEFAMTWNSSMGGEPVGAFVGSAIFVGGLAAAGVGAVAGAILGTVEQEEWQQYLEPVAAAYVSYDLGEHLRARLDESSRVTIDEFQSSDLTGWLESDGHDHPPDRLELRVHFSPLVIRECEGDDRFCFELMARVSLWDPIDKRWAYDRYLMFTNPLGYRSSSPYVRTVRQPSPVGRLSIFRTGDAQAFLEESLTLGTQAIADRILADLGFLAVAE